MFGLVNSRIQLPLYRAARRTRRRPRLEVERLEDRLTPSSAPSVQFAVSQDWGTGFQAGVTLTNPAGAAPVNNWQLAFDYTPQITSIWDATILSHSGSHYLIGNAGWNSTLASGGSVSFGFNGSPGNTKATPANYLLNGVPISGTTPAPPSVSIGSVSVAEPLTGTATVTFPVSLSAPSTTAVTLAYASVDGTAHAGSDYQAVSGTLTFASGQTSQTVAVSILHDPAVPANGGSESFTLLLSNPQGATLAQSSGVGTILNPAAPTGSREISGDERLGERVQRANHDPQQHHADHQ